MCILQQTLRGGAKSIPVRPWKAYVDLMRSLDTSGSTSGDNARDDRGCTASSDDCVTGATCGTGHDNKKIENLRVRGKRPSSEGGTTGDQEKMECQVHRV